MKKISDFLKWIFFFVDTSEADSIIVENQKIPIKDDNKIEMTIHDSGHWLDSMLDSDE